MGVLDRYADDRPRRNETPTPETIEVGLRFRHGRQQAGLSQRRVAERSGISQGEISRFERGRTPGMSAYRVFAIALALGDRFPFGVCPHPHRCAYSSEAPDDRGTRPGVVAMHDLHDSDRDAAGRLETAGLMPPADSHSASDRDAAGRLEAADLMAPADSDSTSERDAAGRLEAAGLMPPADSHVRADGWWDGPQIE